MIGLAAFAGAFTWTLLEYLIHRFLGHVRRFRRTPFGAEHTRHHAEGGYFAPTSSKIVAAAVVAALLCVPAIPLAGPLVGGAYVAGLIAFYGVYEVMHRLEHVHPGFGPYGRWARRHHFYHHFVDPKVNHGVTTPLWDFVFGTYRAPGDVIKVPRKLCMRWLVDPATGDVAAAHASRYAITDGARAGAPPAH